MAKVNIESLRKKAMEHMRSKIQSILTPEEFKQVQFTENGSELTWSVPKEIQDKISKGLKN